MGLVANALAKNRDIMKAYFSLLFRDDLVAWYLTKFPKLNTEEKHRESEERLDNHVEKNVDVALSRISDLAPKVGMSDKPPLPPDIEILKLIEESRNTDKISKMSPTNLE